MSDLTEATEATEPTPLERAAAVLSTLVTPASGRRLEMERKREAREAAAAQAAVAADGIAAAPVAAPVVEVEAEINEIDRAILQLRLIVEHAEGGGAPNDDATRIYMLEQLREAISRAENTMREIMTKHGATDAQGDEVTALLARLYEREETLSISV